MNSNVKEIKPNKRSTSKGLNLADQTPFPKVKFAKLPAGMEAGGDGRSSRTEWNWGAYKPKEGTIVPRERYNAALSAANNYAKTRKTDEHGEIVFRSMAVRDEDNQIVREAVEVDGQVKMLIKEHYIIRV